MDLILVYLITYIVGFAIIFATSMAIVKRTYNASALLLGILAAFIVPLIFEIILFKAFETHSDEGTIIGSYNLVKSEYIIPQSSGSHIQIIYDCDGVYKSSDLQNKKVLHDDGESRIVLIEKRWGFLTNTIEEYYINDVNNGGE